MNKRPFALTPADYSRALNVVGTKVTVLTSNGPSGGYSMTFQQGHKGEGPPPHSHDWDESFFVMKGSVEFKFGGIDC